jgi:hypothetical protein
MSDAACPCAVSGPRARTTASALHGLLREDPRSRAEFLARTRPGG